MQLQENVNLAAYNTFHIEATASSMVVVHQLDELIDWLGQHASEINKFKILGGGSNVLLTQSIHGILLKNELKGIEIIHEDDDVVDVRFQSGENWHDCVLWAVEHQLGGIENLALIPGTIGAAPIQNIGAYGVELKDVFLSCTALHLATTQHKTFTAAECKFGYRDSIFKHEAKETYFITSVALRLAKHPIFKTDYGDIQRVIQEEFAGQVSLDTISKSVIRIRTSKLPDPAVIGNAGSFFKNPVIEESHFQKLKTEYSQMPSFAVPQGVKIPAAWLIEQCGWKGYREGNIGVHDRQALVLVNLGQGRGEDILDLSTRIITSVQQRFNITLEREVNIW
jgi:UDP-N-acetylmuramate dehydrogenase